MEIWKAIKGYEGIYEVSTDGRVRSLKRNNYIMSGLKVTHGYIAVALSKEGTRSMKLLHRVVAETFIPNPDNKPQVNHINGIKSDNRVSNLEWVTAQENIDHAIKTGLIGVGLCPWGVDGPQTCQLRKLREQKGLTLEALSRASGVKLRTIQLYEEEFRNFNSASIHIAYKLAHTLGVSIEKLAGYE